MNKKYSDKDKCNVLTLHAAGNRIAAIMEITGISKTTIYHWINENEKKKTVRNGNITLKEFRELERKYNRLLKIIEILHDSECIVNSPLDVRIKEINRMIELGFNVNTLCDAFKVSKGTYYNRKLRGKNGNTQAKNKREEITPIIKEIYDSSDHIYGPGKIHAVLKDRGYTVSINVVEDIMHSNQWFSIRTGAKKIYEQNQERKENVIKQNFSVTKPNEVWVSDVTELKYNEKKYFLCVIVDLFARKVIAYRVSDKNNTPLTKKTLLDALASRQPDIGLIFHSDRGANYTSRTFMTEVKEHNIIQSFSNPGMPYDNSVMESFFSIFKVSPK